MDFGLTDENLKLRDTVRSFIREHTTPELLAELGPNRRGKGPLQRDLQEKTFERGWLGMSWPEEYGGRDADRVDQLIVEEEFVRADIGVGLGNTFEQAAAIMAVGTPEQKEFFLPRMLRGEVVFAMGYTEPSGGTDLASLQTRAVADGDDYVVNGQKMFTSAAHYATHVYLMVRTDPDAPKHRGISILLVPMDSPGISYTPLWTLTGERTNVLYLDNVRVPRSALLGDENRGWYVGAAALNIGRGGATRYFAYIEQFEHLTHVIKQQSFGSYVLREDPSLQEAVAQMYCDAQVCRLFLWRNISYERRGINPTYEISSQKVWGPEFAVETAKVVGQALGPYVQLTGSELALEEGWFAGRQLSTSRLTFTHGGVGVMRDQIGKRGLGLPS